MSSARLTVHALQLRLSELEVYHHLTCSTPVSVLLNYLANKMVNPRNIEIIYVPADCGSIIPGKSKAPQAFRDSGLVSKLEQTGLNIVSITESDVEARYAVSDFEDGSIRNLHVNLGVCESVYSILSDNLWRKNFQLIIGGECCMLPSIMSAYWHCIEPGKRIGLIYIDADLDLASPTDSDSTGIFAGMTSTHLLGLSGALPEMRRFSRDTDSTSPEITPVCDASNMAFFGTNLASAGNKKEHLGYLFDGGFNLTSSRSVALDPGSSARKTLSWMEQQVDHIVVHLDVDSIDPRMFPLANVGNLTGVSFEKMVKALDIFTASEKIISLVIAEVNPDHDPDLSLTTKLTDEIVEMFGRRFALKDQSQDRLRRLEC